MTIQSNIYRPVEVISELDCFGIQTAKNQNWTLKHLDFIQTRDRLTLERYPKYDMLTKALHYRHRTAPLRTLPHKRLDLGLDSIIAGLNSILLPIDFKNTLAKSPWRSRAGELREAEGAFSGTSEAGKALVSAGWKRPSTKSD